MRKYILVYEVKKGFRWQQKRITFRASQITTPNDILIKKALENEGQSISKAIDKETRIRILSISVVNIHTKTSF